MRFTAHDAGGTLLRERAYYSVGGGFVRGRGRTAGRRPSSPTRTPVLPYPFTTGAELLAHTGRTGLPVSRVMLANEKALGRTAAQVEAGLLAICGRSCRPASQRGLRAPTGCCPAG